VRARAVLLADKTLPCRSCPPCIFLEISGVNLCSAAISWLVPFHAVRSCNLLDRSGFPCVALHWLGSLCGFLDELASLDELIAPSGFKENGGGKKELARLRILLVSKTDNPHVSTRTPSNDKRRAEWWKLISLTRPWDRGRPAEPKPPHQAPPLHEGTALANGLAACAGQAAGVHPSHRGRVVTDTPWKDRGDDAS
jgi:hypothetical protein